MTNDPEKLNHPLEADLARFAPAKLPAALRQRITDQLTEPPLTLGDRLFATCTALGGIAAGLILLIAVYQLNKPEPPRVTPQEIAFQKKITAEYQQLLAAK